MKLSKKIEIEKVTPTGIRQEEDEIVVEVTVCNHYGKRSTVTLPATPADLDELAVGYAVTQGIVSDARSVGEVTKISELERCVEIREELPDRQETEELTKKTPTDPEMLLLWTEEVFTPSELSLATGGVHMAALYISGKKYCRFEDIGRHNALDKAVGYAVLHGQSLADAVMFVSGRLSADYLKKAIRAGVRTVVSPCAVTSRAVETAQAAGVEIWGFARNGRINHYC